MTPNSAPAVLTEPGAHHYRFIGVEFTVADHVKTVYSIVAFGGSQRTLEDTARDLILDRCYIHGNPTGNVFRGLLLNSGSSAIVDSHISEIHVSGSDSQAVLGYNGPGPFKILNNYLEAAGENIMFGGADPKIPNLVPSDIEIRHNHLSKPARWRQGEPNFVGIQWTVKNLLELKNAQRVHVEGNLLENVWAQAQGGAAVVLTPRNQDGGAPWSVVQDVLFRNNIVRNAGGAFGGQNTDDIHPSQPMRRIAVSNNLWLSIGHSLFTMAVPRGQLEDFTVDHNTALPTKSFAYDLDAAGPPALTRFQYTNNLTGFGVWGIKFPRTESDSARWLSDALIAKNALVNLGEEGNGRGSTRRQPWSLSESMYISLDSAEAAGLNADGTLAVKSPLKGAGTDGQDIGVNFDELQRAIRGGIASQSGHASP